MLDFDGSRKVRQREAAFAASIFVLALILFFLPAAYQAPIRKAVRNSALRPFLTAQSALASRRAMSVDVTQLRAQRDSLVALVAAQATLAEENRRLREMQGLRARGDASFISAEVIRLGVGPAESTFMVNVGRAEGIKINSPVIAAEGLLGIVIEVDEHLAIAREWTHPDFRASAMTADGSAHGVVMARRGDTREQDQLVLTGAPFHTDIRPGTTVVTTGRGLIYPRGIPLGIVIGIEEADTGWRKSYLLRPAVRPEAATHVLVGLKSGSGEDYSELWTSGQQNVVIVVPDTTGQQRTPETARPQTQRRPAPVDTTRPRTDTIPLTTTGN